MTRLSPPAPAPEPVVAARSAAFEAFRAQFDARPGYLAACTMGIAPRDEVAALEADVAAFAHGDGSPVSYGAAVERARAAFARLCSVAVDDVAVGSQVSVAVGMIAASLPEGSEVLVVEGDFSSIVYPFLVRQSHGVSVRSVPLDDLASSIRPGTTLVSFSLVQSATGGVADVDAIRRAAQRHGAATLCDTTQATGWMPVDAALFDATVCHAYKWLCSPRGASFLTVSPEFAARLEPSGPGWYAGDDVWASCYGPAMALAATARRFDVSPAWPSWVGAAVALELFAGVEAAELRDHAVGLADALCERLGMPAAGSAIVTWPDADGSDYAAMTAAGITASARAGRARVAFHVWNDDSDIDLVCAALGR